jgi:2,4-dienoyl-CoA reductase (NADPH2)
MRDPIFEPVAIHRLVLKNRIYMPAMHLGMATDFKVTDQLVDFYAQRAKGGAGAICVGYATVDDDSGNTSNIGAHRNDFIPGLSRLAQTIRAHGAAALVQLNHAGRYNHSFFLAGRPPVAPSAIASRLTKETPRALTVEEIQSIVARFAAAARRVCEAGFDGVEVLSGTGYLISEFLSPLTNQRTDAYGGSLANRMRFGLEVITAIRNAVGDDFPVIVRMNGNDFMPQGQSREELQAYARELTEQATVNALSINVGWHEARVPQITSAVPRGAFAYLARSIKTQVRVPVIYGHRVNDLDTARQLVADDMCDLVAMGRALLADPEMPAKGLAGNPQAIVHCVACAQGCFDRLFQLRHVECLCNPVAGHEKAARLEPVSRPRKVMVIGGGPAGMQAALAAAARGHAVTLYDQGDRLGGQLHLAAAPPGREEFASLSRDLAFQLDQRGVPVRLNCRVDENLLRQEQPDRVILATGARPIAPPIPGAQLPHVVQAWDVLLNKVPVGSEVVIIGGGAVGVETALYLADKGTLSGEALKFLLIQRAEPVQDLIELATRGTKRVTLIEMIDHLGEGIGKTTRWTLVQDLRRYHVRAMTATKALEITAGGVKIQAADGAIEELPADTVVLGVGSQPENRLAAVLEGLQIPHDVVGDAHRVGTALEAVHSGFQAGSGID